MKFVFYERNNVETDIIVGVLNAENIPHKVKQITIKHYCFDDEEDEDFIIYEDAYNITCYTDLGHFDWVKHIADERIKTREMLEKCYLKKVKHGKKNSNRSRVK